MNIVRGSKWRKIGSDRVVTIARYDGATVWFRGDPSEDLKRQEATAFLRRYTFVHDGEKVPSAWSVS